MELVEFGGVGGALCDFVVSSELCVVVLVCKCAV